MRGPARLERCLDRTAVFGRRQLALHRFRERHQPRGRPDHDDRARRSVPPRRRWMKSHPSTSRSPTRARKTSALIGRPRSSYLAGVPEVLEYLTDRAEQGHRLVSPLVGRVDHGAAEDDVVREEGDETIQVAGLDCATELLHLALLLAAVVVHLCPMSRISGGYTIRCRERPDRGHVGGTEQPVWLHQDGHLPAVAARPRPGPNRGALPHGPSGRRPPLPTRPRADTARRPAAS